MIPQPPPGQAPVDPRGAFYPPPPPSGAAGGSADSPPVLEYFPPPARAGRAIWVWIILAVAVLSLLANAYLLRRH